MGLSWMLLYEAYARIGVSISSLLYYCGPVIVMMLSPFLFKERPTALKVVGFIVVFVGIFFVNGNVLNGSADAFGILCGGIIGGYVFLYGNFQQESSRHNRT